MESQIKKTEERTASKKELVDLLIFTAKKVHELDDRLKESESIIVRLRKRLGI